MTFTAYATSSANPLGADPGVSICDETGEIAREDSTAVDLNEDGDFDAETADALISALGYTRTGQWQESGGQWGAVAEPI
jgi:hypothetical protein